MAHRNGAKMQKKVCVVLMWVLHVAVLRAPEAIFALHKLCSTGGLWLTGNLSAAFAT